MANKITAVEKARRVQTVYKLVLNGISRGDIHQYVAKSTNWGANTRTIDQYIAEVNDLFAVEAKPERIKELGKAISRYTDLFAKSLQGKQYKTALAAQKELSALLKLETLTSSESQLQLEDKLDAILARIDDASN